MRKTVTGKTHLQDQNLDGIWAKTYVNWTGCDDLWI